MINIFFTKEFLFLIIISLILVEIHPVLYWTVLLLLFGLHGFYSIAFDLHFHAFLTNACDIYFNKVFIIVTLILILLDLFIFPLASSIFVLIYLCYLTGIISFILSIIFSPFGIFFLCLICLLYPIMVFNEKLGLSIIGLLLFIKYIIGYQFLFLDHIFLTINPIEWIILVCIISFLNYIYIYLGTFLIYIILCHFITAIIIFNVTLCNIDLSVFLIVLDIIYIFSSLLLFVLSIALFTLLERKLLGSLQRRRGPNVTGLLGFIQPFADGIKLLFKEHVYIQYSSLLIYIVAPILSFGTTLLLLLCLPIINSYSVFNIELNILFIIAISSFGIHGIIYAGWSSNPKYALLGSLRSGAQLISYELTMSLIILIIISLMETSSLDEISYNQTYTWNLWRFFGLWILFLICSLAEGARIPFDLPEAEAELVAGYNVEYSAISFAMFFLGEYGNLILFSNLSVLLFTGFSNSIMYYLIKVAMFSSIYVLIRGAYPRYRYDQLMMLGWQILLPLCFFYLILFEIINLIILTSLN